MRTLFLTYSAAVLAVGVAFLIRIAGWSIFQDEVPFGFFFPALAIASWYGGFGPGVLATGLSTLIVAGYFLPPFPHFRAIEGAHIVHLCIYALTGTLISWLMGKLRAAIRRSEAAEQNAERRAAEAQEGKRILDALMKYIPAGVAITDEPGTKIRKISDFWCEFIGQSRESVEGAPLASLLDRRQGPRPSTGGIEPGMAALPLLKALHNGKVITGEEWSLERANGTPTPILCGAGAIRDEAGNIVQGVIAWSDIAERKRMEEELRQAYIDMEVRVQERTADLARINRELAVERNKLRGILDAMPDAVYIVNRQYEIEYLNPAIISIFGPLKGSKCHSYFYKRDDACPWCKNKEVFDGKALLSEWISLERNRVFDVFEAPIFNYDGSVSKLKILHDITEHKRVQEQLRHNEGLMRKMLETLPVGILICDKEGRLLTANPHARQIWGGLVGVGFDRHGDLKAWRLDTGKRIESDEWAVVRAIRKGETTINEEIEIECPDGTRKIILNSVAPVRDDSGELLAVLMANQDITARKRAEEERAREQEQLKSLWRISRNVDLELKDLYNHVLAEMLAMTQSQYGFFGFLHEERSAVTIHSWSRKTLEDCGIENIPYELPIADSGAWGDAVRTKQVIIINDYGAPDARKRGVPTGHIKLSRLLVVPVLSHDRIAAVIAVANKNREYTNEDADQINAFMISVQAIVEKKKAEAALRESQNELQRLSSQLLTTQEEERKRISRELHDELGQTLMLVKLRIGLIEMNLAGNPAELKNHCENASLHINSAIENMRRLSRHLCPAVLEDLGVTAALRRLIKEFAEASSIKISVDMDDIDHLLSPDRHIHLYRIVQEALTNIMKHSEASQVTISAKEESGRVLFHVHDNGKGMDFGEIESRSKTGSRGLGLAIMRERLRTLGTSLEMQSSKGAGTGLKFSIPIPKGVVNDGMPPGIFGR